MFSERAFELLDGLEAENTKVWFDAHRAEVKVELTDPFAEVLSGASARLAGTDMPLTGGPKTMFRMHRDTRFSSDKRPYKTNVGGLLTRHGTKTEAGALVYLHLDSVGGFTAAGFYRLSPRDLGPIRDRIVAEPDEFSDVLAALDRTGLALGGEDALTSMPRGYTGHGDHRHAGYLKLRSFILRRDLARADWIEGTVMDRLCQMACDAAPLLRFGDPRPA